MRVPLARWLASLRRRAPQPAAPVSSSRGQEAVDSMSGDRQPLPDSMPIVERAMADPERSPVYQEPELTAPTDLCDARGGLNPEAVGWSRRPLVRANLRGHWPRKKRWNFWNWIDPDFVFSVTLADIDYAAFCAVSFTDFASGERHEGISLGRPRRFEMPEHVERTVAYRGGGMEYRNASGPDGWEVRFRGPARDGTAIEADFSVGRPAGHESLDIVVPWSRDRFQLNSKHNTLPCQGSVTVGGRRYVLDPARCHGVQDYGRGIWPYRSFWNWGAATGVQDGVRVGVNVGAKWTTGTGINENALCVDGRLYKVMEDLRWDYDPGDWRKPWRVRAEHSGALDLTLAPRYEHRSRMGLGPVSSAGVCCFGSWSGTLRFEGRTLEVRDLPGWAEEFAHRW